MNVLLIGYRGSGKTTVGRLLAERLGWTFIDADEELQRRAGRSIADIFQPDGEPTFRDLEAALLRELVTGDRQVLSLGGGVVMRPENRELIQAAGIVVWLTADSETLWNRIRGDATTAATRPRLTSVGDREEIERLLALREPWYRDCATLIVDTRSETPTQIVASIAALSSLE